MQTLFEEIAELESQYFGKDSYDCPKLIQEFQTLHPNGKGIIFIQKKSDKAVLRYVVENEELTVLSLISQDLILFRRLLLMFIAEASQIQFQNLHSRVDQKNEKAVRLNKKLGLKIIKRGKKYFYLQASRSELEKIAQKIKKS